MKTDKRIDAYISRAEIFAQPILEHLRAMVQKACPEVEETMKWSFPHFIYNGAILCSMASFKNHCAFGFWRGSLIAGLSEKVNKSGDTAMGQFGKITSLKNLPSYTSFNKFVKKAMKLTDENVKMPQRIKADKPKILKVPDYFLNNLKKNKKAFSTFSTLSYSCKKEYVEWITEAKVDVTRERRMATAIDWMEEGKSMHWKYKK